MKLYIFSLVDGIADELSLRMDWQSLAKCLDYRCNVLHYAVKQGCVGL